MRDFIVILGFMGLLPLCFTRPFIGMLVWTWFTLMSPHREVYGFAQSFQFNALIIMMTAIGLLISSEKIRPILNKNTVWFLLWFAWTIITMQVSLAPQASYDYFMRIPFSLYIYTIFLILLINREERIISIVWMSVVSLGYYGVTLGLIGILKGGSNVGSNVFGPVGTLLEDRNHMALALCMIIPLIHYLITYTQRIFVKNILWCTLFLNIIAILVSYSRGGWLCLIFVGSYYFYFVKNKILYIILIIIGLGAGTLFMPDEWSQRMDFKDVSKDQSLNGRFEAWSLITEIAKNNPLMGSGFQSPQDPVIFAKYRYATELDKPLAAHSIYFQVLGEHGFTGLFIFLMLIVFGFISNYKTRKMTKDNPKLDWCRDLSNSLQVSLGTFCIGGAALSLAYFDIFHIILILSFSLNYLVGQKCKTESIVQKKSKYTNKIAL